MNMTLLDGHRKYIQRTYHWPHNTERVWLEPLEGYVDGHVDWDCNFGQFEQQQRKLLLEVIRRVAMIPPRGNRTAGLAMVMLCCHLAKACRISDAAAFRIVTSIYEWQSQGGAATKPPIGNLNAFRVTKTRLTNSLPLA